MWAQSGELWEFEQWIRLLIAQSASVFVWISLAAISEPFQTSQTASVDDQMATRGGVKPRESPKGPPTF